MIRCNFVLLLTALMFHGVAPVFSQERLLNSEDVLYQMVYTLGGREKLEGVRSMKMVFKEIDTTRSDNNETTTTWFISDGKFQAESSSGTRHGFDGTRHWIHTKGSEPKWNDSRKRYPFHDSDPIAFPLNLSQFPGTIQLGGIEELEGKLVYQLSFEPSEKTPRGRIQMDLTELLIDVDTLLPVQYRFKYKTIDLFDYRDVDGILVPFGRRSAFHYLADLSPIFSITTESIELNLDLDESLFVSPVVDAEE